MLKKILTGIISTVAALFMMIVFASAVSGNVYADYTKDTSNTTVGTDGICMPDGILIADPAKRNCVYYGEYNGIPLKFRALDKDCRDFGGRTMLLDCDTVLYQSMFDVNNKKVWANSVVRAELNGSKFLNNSSVFTDLERDCIFPSTKSKETENDGAHWNEAAFAKLDKDKIFVLDVVEATSIKYGYAPPNYMNPIKTRRKRLIGTNDIMSWWLRSPTTSIAANLVAMVNGESYEYYDIEMRSANEGYVGVSPALNVNLNSVILSTRLSGEYNGKPAEYKLTLRDPGYTIRTSSRVTRINNQVKVPYMVESTSYGFPRISVVMTDGTWNDKTGWSSGAVTKYYGQIDMNTRTFTLPENYDKSWNTYIIAEVVNGEKETDHASAPCKITIPENNLISTVEDWEALRTYVSSGGDTSGTDFKLGKDLSVSTMIGTDEYAFCGTFDGCGHTLTFNTTASDENCAPFKTTKNAVIRNLHTAGTIQTGKKYAAGMIAYEWGKATITNCRSSIDIESTVSGDGTHGGFVGHGDAAFEGCLFDGKIIGANTTSCAGFIGWADECDSNFYNCLFAPSEVGVTKGSAVLYRYYSYSNPVVNPIYVNCYYTQAMEIEQGLETHSVKKGEGVSSIGFGDTVTYNVSGITILTRGNQNNCIEYKGVFYAGKDMHVSLDLPDPTAQKKIYFATAGTLSGSGTSYQLVMPDDDVVIYALNDLQDAEVVLSETVFIYNKQEQAPTVVTIDGKTLTLGTDYTMTIIDSNGDEVSPKDVGTYTVKIEGTGQYTGTATATFEIREIATVTIYRLYNPKTKEHLWTSAKKEYTTLPKYGWKQEGNAWNAPSAGTGVLRLYNPKTKDHHYTSSANEAKVLTSKYGWKYDNNQKPVFYSGGDVPIYRLYNKSFTVGSHHLTKSKKEYDTLVNYGWKKEGIALYCVK